MTLYFFIKFFVKIFWIQREINSNVINHLFYLYSYTISFPSLYLGFLSFSTEKYLSFINISLTLLNGNFYLLIIIKIECKCIIYFFIFFRFSNKLIICKSFILIKKRNNLCKWRL